MGKCALIVIDFINEMVHPDGKLAAKGTTSTISASGFWGQSSTPGYAAFIQEKGTFARLNEEIAIFANLAFPVIFVGLGFAEDWADQPKSSPVFYNAHQLGILQRDTWSTALHDDVEKPAESYFLSKQRISPFYGTFLEGLLRSQGVERVLLAGVATDFAVEAAARDAHDRDFQVDVVSAACAAASDEDHTRALLRMSKFANIRCMQ